MLYYTNAPHALVFIIFMLSMLIFVYLANIVYSFSLQYFPSNACFPPAALMFHIED